MSSILINDIEKLSNKDIEELSGNILEHYSSKMIDNLPNIDSAIKNLIAFLLGKSMGSSMYDDESIISPNCLSLNPDIAISCARVLVKSILSYKPLSLIEWGEKFPQGDNQNTEDRLDEITKYKVAHFLYYKSINNGGKITKMFGKLFFQWTKSYDEIRDNALNIGTSLPSSSSTTTKATTIIPEDILIHFLDTFGKSINIDNNVNKNKDLNNSVGNNLNDNLNESKVLSNLSNNNSRDSDLELIWCFDFKKALLERQEKRKIAISSRFMEDIEYNSEKNEVDLRNNDENN